MADQEDVRGIALALPETSEADDRFAFSVRAGAKEKGFVWAWNERVEPKKPRIPRADVVAVRVVDLADKDALIASDEEKFFTEPHYNGFPAILVRLPAVSLEELEELIEDAWRCQVPAPRRGVRRGELARAAGRLDRPAMGGSLCGAATVWGARRGSTAVCVLCHSEERGDRGGCDEHPHAAAAAGALARAARRPRGGEARGRPESLEREVLGVRRLHPCLEMGGDRVLEMVPYLGQKTHPRPA